MIAGNVYDKYGTRNPVARWLMRGFTNAVRELADRTGAREVHEVGCGEGNMSKILAEKGRRVRATDASPEIIARARREAGGAAEFEAASIESLSPDRHSAELVACLEVLEHVDDPDAALRKLVSLARPWLLLSVPREPLWRALNLARGAYWKDLGNTPGHRHHWSAAGFTSFVKGAVDIVELRTPLPWTIVLGRKK